MNLNFKDAAKHITGEKRPERASKWMERFIKAAPRNDKKFLKKWFANQHDMTWNFADWYRIHFAQWKREEKSRSAKASGRCAKPRTKLKKESDDLINTVIREGKDRAEE